MSTFTGFWGLYTEGREYGYRDAVYAGGWHRGQDVPGAVKELPWLGKNIPLLRPGKLYYRGYKTKIGYVWVYNVGDEYDAYCHVMATSATAFRLATWGEKTGSSWGGPHLHLVRSKYWDAAWNTNRAVLDPRPVIKSRLAETSKPAGGGATPVPVPTTLEEDDMILEFTKPVKSNNVYAIHEDGSVRHLTAAEWKIRKASAKAMGRKLPYSVGVVTEADIAKMPKYVK
jgi:hypothetical protein